MLCQEVKDRIASADPDTLRLLGHGFNPNVRRQQVKRDADALAQQFAGYFGDGAQDPAGGGVMSRRAREESARRVSDCVAALLQDQPFFGSLALRLPIRPDASPRDAGERRPRDTLLARVGGRNWRGPRQDRDRARGAGLRAEAPHPPGRARSSGAGRPHPSSSPTACCATPDSGSRPRPRRGTGSASSIAYDRLPEPLAGTMVKMEARTTRLPLRGSGAAGGSGRSAGRRRR